MSSVMNFYVNGACRRLGRSYTIGAAACVLETLNDTCEIRSMKLSSNPIPTNHRAELMAIIMALRWAEEETEKGYLGTPLNVQIRSDSKHAVEFMTKEIHELNASADNIVNGDLIQEAADLMGRIQAEGSVEYIMIPRDENELASEICQNKLADIRQSLISDPTPFINVINTARFN
ncbi:ribonuclease H-like domain-containing protein [Xylaria bambusicola]|uniref:ribonuclease H-like domain-containing protein n=1 Tax=Xylaria bambusicola TaxID=326684 RepID=UPI00200792DD|nr:ribonuclease H-like domain-containing protein [Xylaria bambusicola]KAI0526213.1 ribonuclease H-like domain-containing protein [Xylaria bambusicola]